MIVVLTAGLFACDEFVSILPIGDTPQMEGLSGEISIGLLYPITGPLAPTGATMKHGFELVLEEINNAQLGGARLKFVIEDDRGTAEGAVEAFNKLIHQNGVSVIIGPTTSSAAREAFPIAQENQVVAFSPTSAASGLSTIGDFIFRVTLIQMHISLTASG
jgi:branched-chain amino acid transport system substrate-binding protein